MAEERKVVGDLEHIGSLREKLLAVSDEIDAMKNSFSKSAEDLTRIQSMLSVGHLDEISSVLERFEGQVAEAEKQRIEASDGAKKYNEELEKEKERLIKLWDAYKNQEEELSSSERKISELEDSIKMVETSKKQLEDDLTSRINTLSEKLEKYGGEASQFEEYKQKCEEFDGIRNQLEREIHDLKDENSNQEDMINNLNSQISQLKELENYAEYKDKFEEMSAEYEKEKERLTKLYQLYEETDNECKILREENKKWQNWYDTNKEIFNKLFSASPPTSTKSENPVEEPPEVPPEIPPELENPSMEKEKPKKRKRKFRLKKK